MEYRLLLMRMTDIAVRVNAALYAGRPVPPALQEQLRRVTNEARVLFNSEER